jgi:hypothetical protein
MMAEALSLIGQIEQVFRARSLPAGTLGGIFAAIGGDIRQPLWSGNRAGRRGRLQIGRENSPDFSGEGRMERMER